MSDDKKSETELLREAHNKLIDAHNDMIRKFNALVGFVGIVASSVIDLSDMKTKRKILDAFATAKKELEK